MEFFSFKSLLSKYKLKKTYEITSKIISNGNIARYTFKEVIPAECNFVLLNKIIVRDI